MLIDWEQYAVRITYAGRTTWTRGQSFGWKRTITDHDLWFVFQGIGVLRAKGGVSLPLATGTCLWLTPDWMYEAVQNPNHPVGNYYVHFELYDNEGNVRPYNLPTPGELLDPVDSVVVDAIMRRVTELIPWFTQETARQFSKERIAVAETLVKGLLMDLDNGAQASKNRTLSGTRRHHHQVVMQAIAMIQDRMGTPCTVSELAEQASYSPEHFSRIFRGVIGRSVEEFLITARIERAKVLLSNSSESIEKIAEILGYGSPGFFSTQFRKRTGSSPRDFRLAAAGD